MRKIITLLLVLCCMQYIMAQETEDKSLQMESLVREDDEETDTEDDTYWQQLDYLKKHPVNINKAGAAELKGLNLITDVQLQYLLRYRKMFGELISIYELQAVPGWDIETIRKILPCIKTTDNFLPKQKLATRLREGDHTLSIRYARVLGKADGYKEPNRKYAGSRDKLLMRYKYNYNNTLQWGMLGDKDAGEQFFAGKQQKGFDFYSFHACVSKIGMIKTLILGDFTVNMGQGLIMWQSMAFGKGAQVVAVKRQSPVLHPYTAAGESNFHRGAGITLQKDKWELTFFISRKKTDGNLSSDSTQGDDYITSFPASGYHRNAAENADKGIVSQHAASAALKYQAINGHIGINAVRYTFSKPLIKSAEPYNLFAANGTQGSNMSVDYSYTWRNLHVFGEMAADIHLNKSFLSGAIISLDATADIAFVYRNISRSYQALYGNAFTENTKPVNETGLYTGISVRAAPGFTIDAYADMFTFPWLRFRAYAPGSGTDYFVRCIFNTGKHVEVSLRYAAKKKPLNRPGDDPAYTVAPVLRQSLRLHTTVIVNRNITLQNRVELIWYDKNGPAASQGFLGYMDASFKLPASWGGNIRMQYFEADSYDSRVYAFENDGSNGFSIPAFYDKGLRYYLNVKPRVWQAKAGKWKKDIWLRWAQTIYNQNVTSIGSGADKIDGRIKSEIKLQVVFYW